MELPEGANPTGQSGNTAVAREEVLPEQVPRFEVDEDVEANEVKFARVASAWVRSVLVTARSFCVRARLFLVCRSSNVRLEIAAQMAASPFLKSFCKFI